MPRVLLNIGDGFVKFEFDHAPTKDGGKLEITVSDSGPGFNYESKKETTMVDSAFSGRGIPLIRSLCDNLQYQGNGNIVKVNLSWLTNIEE